MRFEQTFHMFITIPSQPQLDFIIAIDRKVMKERRTSTRSEWQSLDVIVLSEVRRHRNRCAIRRSHGTSKRKPADLLGRRQISLHQRRGESPNADVVEAIASIVERKQRCDVQVQRE